jgi:hypothetical protein
MNDVIENSVPSEKNDVSAIENPPSSGVKVTGFRRFIAVDTLILLLLRWVRALQFGISKELVQLKKPFVRISLLFFRLYQ